MPEVTEPSSGRTNSCSFQNKPSKPIVTEMNPVPLTCLNEGGWGGRGDLRGKGAGKNRKTT